MIARHISQAGLDLEEQDEAVMELRVMVDVPLEEDDEIQGRR